MFTQNLGSWVLFQTECLDPLYNSCVDAPNSNMMLLKVRALGKKLGLDKVIGMGPP